MKRSTHFRFALGVLGVAAAASPRAALAQFRDVPPPPAYALRNVTVVHADGRMDAGVNLVVRNGLVEALGPGADIPADATVLEGDSLYVYPGLVDAHGKAEVAFPEIARGDSVRPWDAPREVQGLLAHRRVADHLDQGGAAGQAQRAAGIVAAGIHPDGALAAGIGAAILLRTDVDRPWQLVVNDRVGLAMAFRSGQGVYPSTLFGVMAYMRQAFEDAKRDGAIRDAHGRDPGGLSLPAFDPDYDVLRAAMRGELPVFFAADGAGDIRRVLALSDEYGFRPVVVGGQEAWRVAEELAQRDVPVIIDGDFPEPREWEPAEEASEDSTITESGPAPEARALEPAAAREKERIENVRANAGRLAAAGVRFAISSGGGDGDIREAARLSIEHGLSPDVALRSVTTVPAELLGVPSVTRIGAGLPATFVALTGPIFEEGSEVAHAFVEGGYEKGAGGGRGGAAPAGSVTGDWTFTFMSGGQEIAMEASLTMSPDGAYRGNVTSDQFGSAPIRGRVAGSRMTFTITLSFGGQEIELGGEGTLEGDQFTGGGDGPMGAYTVTGRKAPGGAR